MKFFALSVLVYGALTAWLTSRLAGTTAEWGFTMAHMILAAALNAHLLWVTRRRSLSLLGSAPVAFLFVNQLYFTINGLKYFSPILYTQFDLSLAVQFAGSAAGAAVLFACALLLQREQGPTSQRMLTWVNRYWSDIRRLMFISAVGSLACKVALYKLGYGSTYTDTPYHEHAVRAYGDYFILLGNDIFGALVLVLGAVVLFGRDPADRARPLTRIVAALGVLSQVVYGLWYLKARMTLLVAGLTIALVSEVVSRQRAERFLQALFILLPPLSLLGVQLTLLIGRINVPEDTGLRLSVAAVNRRADITDFATAVLVSSNGQAHDARIVTTAALNAIPRVFFLIDKQALVGDVYSDILEQQLGWPAGAGEDMKVDYQDSIFSAGVMAVGAIGFVLAPLLLLLVLYWVSRWIERTFTGLGYGLALLALWLSAMHTEVEMATIPLNFRQAASFALICYVLAWVARLGHQVLMVASRAIPASTAAPGTIPGSTR